MPSKGSSGCTDSPERVNCTQPPRAVEETGVNVGETPSRSSPHRQSGGSREEVRLSDSCKDLPSILQHALGLQDSQVTQQTNHVRGLDSGLPLQTVTPQENQFLRDLVNMQQAQMVELQRQISDLHSLVAGIASRNLVGPAQTATMPNTVAGPEVPSITKEGKLFDSDGGRTVSEPGLKDKMAT